MGSVSDLLLSEATVGPRYKSDRLMAKSFKASSSYYHQGGSFIIAGHACVVLAQIVTTHDRKVAPVLAPAPVPKISSLIT